MDTFYKNDISSEINFLTEEESRHCALVLRHQPGDTIRVFDGRGKIYTCKLTHVNKKKCAFQIEQVESTSRKSFAIHLGIAPTKNMDRMEWMVEKLGELGVDQVTFIETVHSERRTLRLDRLEKKAISAMKQSGNPYLLQINPLVTLHDFISTDQSHLKIMAHVHPAHPYLSDQLRADSNVTVLIGPEGDFSPDELTMATQHGFVAVSLGTHTYRTETAGLVACCMINFCNKI